MTSLEASGGGLSSFMMSGSGEKDGKMWKDERVCKHGICSVAIVEAASDE